MIHPLDAQSIQKCSELKPPEHLGTANLQPLRQFPPRLPLSSFPLGFLRGCALSATLDMQIGGLLQRAATSRPAGERALRALANNRRIAKRRTSGGRMRGQRALTSSPDRKVEIRVRERLIDEREVPPLLVVGPKAAACHCRGEQRAVRLRLRAPARVRGP
jgi:hypothetical protein